ncbi:hypothetical protein QYE76_004751 [Lolium multiflorum]|uniref:Uncharacterized protein n=1 Tax=Lolium multiflorum TaxID=4521 RepID=A0AAD8W2R8_LOLMU|nr:hypothetical protein QYE76_004751 [Lolium multiflorum]
MPWHARHAVSAHWPRQGMASHRRRRPRLQAYPLRRASPPSPLAARHTRAPPAALSPSPSSEPCRHGTARTSPSPGRHRPSFGAPSSALAPPRRRLHAARPSLPLRTSPEQPQSQARTRRSSQTIAIDWSSPEPRHGTRSFFYLANVASNLAIDLRRPTAPSDPLGVYDQEKMVIFDIKLMVGFGCDTIPILKVPPQYPKWMEPYVQTETYDLENGGSLVFERDLYLVSERLERPPPKFHGVRIHNTPAGEQQWMITADLKGSSEPPISERILFSFKAYSWVDGLAHALQEGLARVCGQNIAALRGSRFAHFARHDTMGEPMALSSHPVLKIHVQHLDFMLHETRKDLELTRVHSHRAQMALAHHADAIRLLAKDRRSLRLQRAKNVATINRLREKIRTLEVTVRTQQDQIQEMEEDGEDIQGGDDFLSDDNDFEDDEFTDEEDYEFLESAEDGIIPIDVDEDNEE